MDKKIAKKYILAIIGMFIGFFAVSSLIVFGIDGVTDSDLTIGHELLYVFLSAIIPVSFFNGYCVLFLNKGVMKRRNMLLFVIFIIPIVLVCVPVGAITMIPMMIYCIKKILDK